jgi:hypothetical protein
MYLCHQKYIATSTNVMSFMGKSSNTLMVITLHIANSKVGSCALDNSIRMNTKCMLKTGKQSITSIQKVAFQNI